jgi:hypothetical protein
MIDLMKKELIEKYKSKAPEIEDEIKEFSAIRIKRLDAEQTLNDLKEQYQTKNIFSRLIGKKQYQRDIQSISLIIAQLETDISERENSNIFGRLNNLARNIENIESAKTLNELVTLTDTSLEELVSSALANPKKYCLREEDKKIISVSRDDKIYSSVDELVLVHKTEFMPTNNRVASNLYKGVEHAKSFVLDKTRRDYSIREFRNTVHFCLNGEVSSHPYGNFDERKYAVVLPLTEELVKKIVSFNVVDTYFYDFVSLENGYILCPLEEFDLVSASNPSVNVYPYVGKNVDQFADALVTLLGYQVEEVGMWSWANTFGNKRVIQVQEKYNLECSVHSFSADHTDEKTKNAVENSEKVMQILMNHIKDSYTNPIEIFDEIGKIMSNNDVLSSYYYDNFNDHSIRDTYSTTEDEILNDICMNLKNILSEDMLRAWKEILKDKVFFSNEGTTRIKTFRRDRVTDYMMFIDYYSEYFPEITSEQLLEYYNSYRDVGKDKEKVS